MDESPKIPIVQQPVSLMQGPNGGNLAVQAAERHPIDALQRQGGHTAGGSPYRDLDFVRSVYGSGLAMEIAAERQMAQREKRFGVSHVGILFWETTLQSSCPISCRFQRTVQNSPKPSCILSWPGNSTTCSRTRATRIVLFLLILSAYAVDSRVQCVVRLC